MSFSILKAGDTDDVIEQVSDIELQDELGQRVLQFLEDTLADQAAPYVIVEASGHGDSHSTYVDIKVRGVH